MLINIDCDEVCSSFVKGVLAEVKRLFEIEVDPATIDNYLFIEELPITDEQRVELQARINAEGFCLGLDEEPGAYEAIRALRKLGCGINFVTTPYYSSKFWMAERAQWLLQRGFAESAEEIAQLTRKELLAGDVFIDDRADNVKGWVDNHEYGLGIVFAKPWNVNHAAGMRLTGWEQVLQFVSTVMEEDAKLDAAAAQEETA